MFSFSHWLKAYETSWVFAGASAIFQRKQIPVIERSPSYSTGILHKITNTWGNFISITQRFISFISVTQRISNKYSSV